jgi:hypothetical protein
MSTSKHDIGINREMNNALQAKNRIEENVNVTTWMINCVHIYKYPLWYGFFVRVIGTLASSFETHTGQVYLSIYRLDTETYI